MKKYLFFTIILALSILSACNSNSVDRASILRKCTILGNESIVYARANYVKLFHYFNPQEFGDSFQQVKSFDHIKHRNVINTYDIAVRKIKSEDPATESLISACIDLATFSKTLVDQSYPRAVSHQSQHDSLTDNFFIEINQIVKFDHNIGEFDKKQTSFKQQVNKYKNAIKAYINKYNDEIPLEMKRGM